MPERQTRTAQEAIDTIKSKSPDNMKPVTGDLAEKVRQFIDNNLAEGVTLEEFHAFMEDASTIGNLTKLPNYDVYFHIWPTYVSGGSLGSG